MPFITQGKTNWNFLLIVVVLAIIVGGGIWWCTYYKPIPTPEATTILSQKKATSIEAIDFVKYLTDKYYKGLNPSEFCMSERNPIYIDRIKYADLDNDGNEEAIVVAHTCFTGTAGPDINSIYKLLPTGELVELKVNYDFQGKSVFEGYFWRSYRLDYKDGKLFDVILVGKEGDSNCCPTGPTKEVFFKWDGKEFIVTNVLFKD